MRILIISPNYLPSLGGQERQVHELGLSLMAQGHSVVILCEAYDQSYVDQTDHLFTKVVRISASGTRFCVFSRFLAHLLSEQKDYFDLIICRTFSVHSLALSLVQRLRRISPVSVLMMDAETELSNFASLSLMRAAVRYGFSSFAFFSAPSSHLKESLKTFGIPENKIIYIPNGVIPQGSAKLVTQPPFLNFLYLGTIVESKGVFDLLSAFIQAQRLHPRITLSFLGSGPDLDRLKQEAQDGSFPPVRFLEPVSFAKVRDVMSNFDCLVYPSWSEGFGLVPFEAALMPLEIICSDVADLKNLLGERAHFMEPRDREGIQKAIVEVATRREEAMYDNSAWLSQLSFQKLVSTLIRLTVDRP